ncbi:MAG TPA: hypothetical protein VJN71_04430 [Nitrososphaerales archaeon]|nr:hypothetical protein [Nitrososphaerales archaeon]
MPYHAKGLMKFAVSPLVKIAPDTVHDSEVMTFALTGAKLAEQDV